MKKTFLFVIMVLVLSLAGSGRAAVFNVTTPAELRNALNTAENNGEADTINIAAGVYNTLGATFSYLSGAGENHSLTIAGTGTGNTVLDGGGTTQVMNINTIGLVDDREQYTYRSPPGGPSYRGFSPPSRLSMHRCWGSNRPLPSRHGL